MTFLGRWIYFYCGHDCMRGPRWFCLQVVLFPVPGVNPPGHMVAGRHLDFGFRLPEFRLRLTKVPQIGERRP